MNFWNCLHKVDDTDSTGDAEEYERESETVIFAGALFALLAMLFWSHTVTKYHTPAVLKELVK